MPPAGKQYPTDVLLHSNPLPFIFYAAYGTVYLVQKLTGVDKDKIYAMKVLKKGIVSLKKKTAEHTRTERQVGVERAKSSNKSTSRY